MLETRSLEQEEMDNLQLSGEELYKTLDGLTVINRFLGNTNATLKAVQDDLLQAEGPLTIIDLGCGGGDNLRSISKWCISKNIPANLIGIDGNQHVLEYAAQQEEANQHIKYVQANILADDFHLPPCDLLISSHFMYHFKDEDLIDFLRQNTSNIKSKIIFSELSRSRIAYLLFKIGTPFMPFSKMVKEDGLRAIRRSFKKSELENIFKQANLQRYSISWKWAFRYLITVDMTSV